MVRTDNLSAATHDLKNSSGRAMNARYEAVLTHYGVESTRINPRSSHENGVVEQGHRRLKNALDQALILRGGRDFESEDEYRQFVRGVVDRRNRLVASKLKAERRYLRPLPPAPVPEYANYRCRVRRWSTIRVANRTYSVPSRLIGMVVDFRLYADHIEVYYKDHLVESMERIHGAGEARIDYRHITGSLVRKPGAFARYRFREQMMMLLYLSRGLFEYRSRFPDGGVDLPGNVALETADDVALGHSLGDSSPHVCLGPGVMRQSDKDDSIQSGIGLTIAAAV